MPTEDDSPMHQKASRLEDMDVDNQPHQRHIKSKYRKDNEPAPRFTLRVPAMESVPIKAEPLSNANSPAEQQQQQNELITPTPPTGVSNDEGTAEATITGLEAAVTAAEMTSKKRSSVDIDAENDDDQPGPKKQKTSPSPMSAIPDAPKDVIMRDASPSLDELITAKPYTGSMFDTEPMHLLERSIAIALERVGFDGATKQAMNSFKAQVDSYVEHFLSHATASMNVSRRTQPILSDFEYALKKEGLTDHLLHPHLNPPVSKERTQLRLELEPILKPEWSVPPKLLGDELSGEKDKLTKSYIPKKFPSFPSKHTYKATEVMPQREADPRKVREKATEDARHGEEALRRLVGIGKVGEQKAARKFKDPDAKLRHELWEAAMAELLKINDAPIKDGMAQGIIINAEKKYHRQPVTRRP